MNELRLRDLTFDPKWAERAETTLRSSGATRAGRTWANGELLLAVDWATDAAKEIAIVLPSESGSGALEEAARPFIEVLATTFVPNRVLVVAREGELAALGEVIPWVKGKVARRGQATAYVCERGACKLPTDAPREFAAQLGETKGYAESP